MREATISSHRFGYTLFEGSAIVRPEGGCDEDRTEALAKLVNSPLLCAKNLILDLSRVDYVESPGYRWLVRQMQLLESDGKRLVIMGAPPSVERAIKLLRLDRKLPLTKDVKEALAVLDPEHSQLVS
ncbi:MAG: STAS domain-containing protein [Armatimonadetes bacterium]|jgi:anti-anti-sigma factor|nr:STAS domain-containing protein [Armatimonadota bacterium]